MNDSTFEDSLRNLRPSATRPALEQRIGEALATSALTAQTPRHAPASGVLRSANARSGLSRWWRDLGWALAGATAAFVAFSLISGEKPGAVPMATFTPVAMQMAQATPTSADAFEHSAASEELVATEDATEIVETDDGLVRPVRYTYLERHTWANAQTGARMEIEVPREDYYLRPVSIQ